jgi:hypothetical protein
MSATMAVTSREIRGTLGANSVHLHRWAKAGLIRPERWNNNAHGGYAWPDWTWRMVALLRMSGSLHGSSVTAARRPIDTMRLVASVLAEHPDAPWVVIDDDGVALACYTACEVVAIHRRQTCTTVVAIPTLEEACS